MQADQLVSVAAQVISQQVAGQTVIFDIDSEQYFSLDDVGSRVWALLQEHGSLNTVTGLILEEFDVTPQQLELDLQALLQQLQNAGLISVKPV